MKTNPRPSVSLRAFGGVGLLFGSGLLGNSAEPQAAAPLAPAAQPMMMSPAEQKAASEAYLAKILEREANAKVVLRAIGTPGGEPVAMFDVNDEPKLVMLYSELVGSVVEIDAAKAQVTVQKRDGSLRVFTLTEPRPVNFPDFSPQQVEDFIAAMSRGRRPDEGPTSELMRAWGGLDREAKEATLLGYLRSGLVIDISSAGSSSSARLFERQMVQRRQQRLKAFVASLSPEQRDLFRASSQGLVRLDAPAGTQAALADKNRQAGSNLEKLLASLTSEQRKLYDAMRPASQP